MYHKIWHFHHFHFYYWFCLYLKKSVWHSQFVCDTCFIQYIKTEPVSVFIYWMMYYKASITNKLPRSHRFLQIQRKWIIKTKMLTMSDFVICFVQYCVMQQNHPFFSILAKNWWKCCLLLVCVCGFCWLLLLLLLLLCVLFLAVCLYLFVCVCGWCCCLCLLLICVCCSLFPVCL